jgi:hypothetical protein
MNISHACIIWCTFLLILEQYCSFNHVERLRKLSNLEGGLKAVVTIMNVLVLVHLIQFFKYVKRKPLYKPVETKKSAHPTLIAQATS